MNNKQLKERIKTNTLSDSPLILVYEDVPFICRQYTNQIAKNKKLEKININKLTDILKNDVLFDTEDSFLYVYETDKFDETIPEDIINLIVICKQVTSKNPQVEQIKINKLLNWQIEDYVKARVPGLTELQIKWLCEISKYNIYRLEKECDKLSIFSKELQQVLFNQMNSENVYCDLNSLTIFNFITAIVNKDYRIMNEVLENIRWIDIEATGVVTLLLKQFKILIDVAFSATWNNTLTCSEKQFYYFKHNMLGLYTKDQLIEIYEFLTSLDYKLKSGYVANDTLIDYILINVLKFQ